MPESPPSVKCPECAKRYRLKTELLGRKIRCKACHTLFRIPAHPESDNIVGLKISEKKTPSETQSTPRKRRPDKQQLGLDTEAAPIPMTEGKGKNTKRPELKEMDNVELELPLDEDYESSVGSHTDYDLNIVSDSYVERHIEAQKKLQPVEDDPLADSIAKGSLDDLDDGLDNFLEGIGSSLENLAEAAGSDGYELVDDENISGKNQNAESGRVKKKKKWGLRFK